MNFLVDAQLPPALARWLTEQGHPSRHVVDLAFAATPDRKIWEYAKHNKLVVVTKDEDFSHLCLLDPAPTAVIWIRVPNCSRAALLRWFSPLLPAITTGLQQGELLIELV